MKYLRRVIATICLLSVSVSLFADSVSATNATNTKNAVQFDSKAYAIKLNTAVKAYETKKF